MIAVKFEVALMQFRIRRGYSTEARNNVRAALALPEMREPNVARGHALYLGGVLATNQGDYAEAKWMLTECLAIRRALGASFDTAATLSTLSMLHLRQGDVALAREREEEAIALFRAQGNRLGEAHGLLNLGEIAVRQSDDGSARKLFEQCLSIARDIGHGSSRANASGTWASSRWLRATSMARVARFVRSLEVCQGAEDKRNEAIALWCLGKVDAAGGDRESARAKFTDALRAFESFQMSSEALDCLEEFAALMQECWSVRRRGSGARGDRRDPRAACDSPPARAANRGGSRASRPRA